MERGGNTIRQSVDYDDLSLCSVSERDFLSDEDRDRQQNPLPDKRLNHVMDYEAQGLLPSSVRAVTEPCVSKDVHPPMLQDQKRRDRQSHDTRVMKRFQKTLVALEQDLMKTKEEILDTNEYLKEMSRVKSQGKGLMGASLRRLVYKVRGRRLQKIQAQKYIRVNKDFDALIQVVMEDCKDDLNLTGLENWEKEVKRLRMACRACTERIPPPEVCRSPPQVQPSQEEKSSIQRVDLSETEITLVVPRIEDAMESLPLTPPTPEALLPNLQLPRALTPLNRVTVRVVTPTWPESLPAVEYLPLPRLTPITHLSADVKKLLQGGLEGLQQDVMEEKKKTGKGEKKKPGRGEKKAKTQRHVKPLLVLEARNKQPEEYSETNVEEEKKKKKNVGKRFLQWLSRKLICCSDV
ncbi:uncharacterized protein LOC124474144 [Hypomesus transpacificus]|uniref:uncharacterized protein LOC124474144 n=1 Tax=Hypomesus transpacificus TaxID=137520 RepID=UPI001F078B73|nr:uncharacterized protein LOC124474144 [Hypomesus transpacificus]XP_046886012.1 uncharacterized protein LOC124474144 [Hypomesus transpacificus]